MKSWKIATFFVEGLVIASLLISCSSVVEKPTPTATTEPTAKVSTEEPTSTSLPPTLTDTPTAVPPSETPKPTEISYSVVIPIEKMQNQNPWLPMNKSEVPGSAYLAFNLKSKLLKNKDARSAITAATNKDIVLQMAKKYYEIDPKISTSLTPPQVLGVDLTNLVGISYDPQKGKASIAKAGINDTDKVPAIKLVMWISGTREGYRYLLAKEFAKMWQENLGLKTEITTTSTPLNINSKQEWDIYMVIWGADFVDPDNFLGELFTTDKEMNVGGLRSSAYDSIIKQAAKGKTPTERQALYIKAEKMLCEDYIALVPLYTVKNFKR
jgi:oligopeptide transport system substrate-binding protein